MPVIQVSQLNIYPIKSTAGILLNQAQVKPLGLTYDRRWMLVNNEGHFITGRQYPQLTQIRTQIEHEQLIVNAPNMPQLHVPLNLQTTATQPVKVWRDHCTATSMPQEINQWFSGYLGIDCQLVHMSEDYIRATDRQYSQDGDRVSFADGFPLLLISEASLDDLNQKLQNPVTMVNFRPNIVVSGCDAFTEDHWTHFRIGNIAFEGVKGCSRCIFTTVNPITGTFDPTREPLKTLSTFRRRPEGGVFFGQNLIPRSQGIIQVGDKIEL